MKQLAQIKPATILVRGAQLGLATALVFSLVACGQQDDVEAEESGTAAAAPSTASSGQDYPQSQTQDQSQATSETVERWECPEQPGEAPSGTLTAERIPGTEPDREEAGLYEGPVWLNGALYFSDFTFEDGFPSQIQRFDGTGALETAIEQSGSNGLSVDNEGFLMAATHDQKAISRFHPGTGEREIIWDTYEDNRFNSPNDLTLTDDGVIYFTDPDFQRSAAPGGQDETRVYRIGKDGIEVVESEISNPNGIALSPDEQTLYVAGGGENGVLRAYDLSGGDIGASRDLADLSVPDGMAIDCLGNIYATEHTAQRIRVFSPEGEALAEIQVDANITNAVFGGPNQKTLFITGAGTLWEIELNVAGYPY